MDKMFLILWLMTFDNTAWSKTVENITVITTLSKTEEIITCKPEPEDGELCPNNRVCKNGSACSEKCRCRKGYEYSFCKNGNNCKNIAACSAECEDTCTCQKGYESDVCQDFNECRKSTFKCGFNTDCKNLPGGYYCECQKGFRTEHNKTVHCPEETQNCTDIDECKETPSICGNYGICKNTPGTYTCTCQNGFRKRLQGHPKDICIDIDECKETPSICGNYGICKNTPGTYTCTCQNGFRKRLQGHPKDICIVKCQKKVRPSQQPCNSKLCRLQNLIFSATPSCEDSEFSHISLEELLTSLESLLTEDIKKEDRLEFVDTLLFSVEAVAQELALLEQKNMSITTINKTIELRVLQSTTQTEEISLQSQRSTLNLDWKTAAEENTTDLAMIGFLEFDNLTSFLDGIMFQEADSEPLKLSLISHVLSTFASRRNTNNLIKPVSFRLQHTQEKNHNRTRCMFWSHDDKSWKSTGCVKIESTENETLCSCNHMTSFAILMAQESIESWELTLITQICLTISLICLFLSILTFIFCRCLRGTRNTIHTHLCISLFFGNLIFLCGIEAFHNKVACGVIAGLLHMCYLSAFCWMALEGVELYLMLVRVFDTHLLKNRHLFSMGYGVPAFIVIISAAVFSGGYGTKKYCWLSLERKFIWSFIGPICVILMINCGIFLLTIWKLAEKMSSINPDQGKYKKIRSLTLTAVAQLCILGCTWVFGLLLFGQAILVFAYIFSILNSLQGLQILILHCLMNAKVRAEYSHWVCAIAHFKTPSTYSEFSSNIATNTLTREKSANKESNF
ncbi:adhesion G protein-coupled receptor E5 isoform 2-T2 [Discoglossus pictus]